jgi:predicted signal transduction protein with EAL and GGDEF domain
MFGSSVAITYGVLMAFNVVYTLFFATTIVCALRGLLWWGLHLRDKARERAALRAAAGTEPADSLVPA